MSHANRARWRGNINSFFLLIVLGGLLWPVRSQALSAKLGDLNSDGAVDVLDLVILINHLNGSSLISQPLLPLADLNDDGRITPADVDALADAILGLPNTVTPKAVTLEPGSGSSEVGVTVRPKVTFPKPIDTATLNSDNFYASFAGQKLPAAIVPASDGAFAWLFFNAPMPSASQIQVTVDGSTIHTSLGLLVDAAGTGTLGSAAAFNFSTVSVTPIPNTVLSSRVVDPGPDLIPRTADDITLGGNGYNYLLPIRGVKVYVLGMENNVAYTDANGRFTLTNVPVGDVKVVLDGRTATNPPAGYYFPEMVMDTTFSPGITNGVMTIRDTNGVVVRDPNGVPIQALAMYLPRIASNVLQTVSAAVTNMIMLQSNAAYSLPPEQQQYLTLEIMPNSLIGMDGQPMSAAQVGVSVVPPELVKDMLPPGLLQHTFDITVQAPGIATFSTPARMTFPNVFNAAPGTQLNFLSFDHTTGRLVIEGTATVSDDGLYVTTDPGTGVTHPGWHGLTLAGALADLLTAIVDVIPPQCRKAVEDIGGISLGLGGVIAATAGAPLVAAAAAVSAIGLAGLDAYNEGWTFDDFTEIERGTFEAIGTLFSEIKQSRGAPVKSGLFWRFANDPIGSDIFVKHFRQLAKKMGQFSEGASRVFVGVGSFLQGLDLGKEGLNCFFGESFAASSASATPPTDAIVNYLGQLDAAGTPVMDAVIDLIGTKLAPHLPSDRPVFLVSDGPNLHGIELDASDYIDPVTGAPLNIPIATLVDDNLFTDPAFRDRAHTIAQGLNTLKSLFVESNPSLIACRQQIDGLMAAAHELFLQNLSPHPPTGPIYYRITDFLSGALIASGTSGSAGHFQFFGADHRAFLVQVYAPQSRHYGEQILHSGMSGQPFGKGFDGKLDLFALPSDPTLDPDSDGDGLSDLAELVIGTDPTKWSTAGDGISDGAKVAQGLDPLSGAAFATGVIASLPLPGVAKEIVLSGSTSAAGEQTAYVACGSRGLSIVNASKFQMPILFGQLDLPGDATDVAVDSSLQIAVVAANGGGLHFINVANPMQPQLIRTIGVNASQVEAVRGIAYVTVGAQIWSYDMASGSLLQTLALGGADLTGLASEGLFLYSMDANRVLRAVDITDPVTMVTRDSLTLPNGTGRLFVGNGVAYLAAELAFPGGFATADVSNPDSLILLSGADANNVAGKAVVPNGSGLAVAVGSPGNFGNVLDVMNVSDPASTGTFLTRYALPADPFSVAIGSGIAFVADGTAGLQVVNYRPFDNQGVPPTISLSNSFPMATATNGIVEEGKSVRVAAITSDDVQVRDVEFYIDGVKQLTDVSFPFEYRFVTPMRTASKTNFTLQAKATDTGGNTNWTPLITVTLVPDATPPRVSRTFPIKDGYVGSSDNVGAYFTEPVQAATLTPSTVFLKSLGADGLAGTADDVAVTNGVISYRDDLNAVFLRFPTNLAPGAYQASISPPIADLAGNPIASTYSWQFYIIGGQDSDQDGLPDVVEIVLGLDPTKASTFNDGILDGDRDLNGDGLRASWKLRYGYDPLKRDSFGDGILDKDRDPDMDTLANLQEQNYGTNPLKADTDGDGWPDEAEITAGSNPLDPLSRPKLFVVANPAVGLVLPAFNAARNQLLNTFVASPPVGIALPGRGDPGGIPLNTVIAYPPVQVSLLVLGGSGGPSFNTFIARPPIQVTLPGLGGGIPVNTTIAQPPVSIQLPGP